MSAQLKAVDAERISQSDLDAYRFALSEFNQAQELAIKTQGAIEMLKRYLQSRYQLKEGDKIEMEQDGLIIRNTPGCGSDE